MSIEQLKTAIRDVPDFPKEGILFKDITPVLSDPDLFRKTVDLFADHLAGKEFSKLAVIESRGFIFGSALAYHLGVGLVPVRKQGKLPYDTVAETYDLEYGTATVEIHVDAVEQNEKVVILDDLLATGGTAAATLNLIRKLGGDVVEVDFLIELAFLKGREKLPDVEIYVPIVF